MASWATEFDPPPPPPDGSTNMTLTAFMDVVPSQKNSRRPGPAISGCGCARRNRPLALPGGRRWGRLATQTPAQPLPKFGQRRQFRHLALNRLHVDLRMLDRQLSSAPLGKLGPARASETRRLHVVNVDM